MNIENLNQLLKKNGLQEFPLDFAEKLNNKKINIELFKQINHIDFNPLMIILSNNKNKDLGFKNNEILDLINLYPEQLLQISFNGYNPLIYIFFYNKTQKLGFSFEYINNIYEKQINKKYNYIGYNNRKHTILFNEEYILNKFKKFNFDLTFFQEFLDYRKTLLEKQQIIKNLKVDQNKNNLIKI